MIIPILVNNPFINLDTCKYPFFFIKIRVGVQSG